MFIKCPRCELNYMVDTDKLCKICFREIHGDDKTEEHELCTICNETSVMPGKEFCLICLRELNDEKADVLIDADDNDDEPLSPGDGSASNLNEIIPDIQTKDIPEPELEEIDKDLSLEELEEQEENESSMDEDDDI